MPMTFEEKMAQVEQKNQAQRINLANTFLPVFQGIAQKKILDEQYATEQKRVEAEKAKASAKNAQDLNKAFNVTVDPTVSTGIQNMVAEQTISDKKTAKTKAEDMQKVLEIGMFALPENYRKEFATKSAGLNNNQKAGLLKSYEDKMDETKKKDYYRWQKQMDYQYSQRQIGSGVEKLTEGQRNIITKAQNMQKAIKNGKKYQATLVSEDGKKQTVSGIVKAYNDPKLGGTVWAVVYGGRQYKTNGTSFFATVNGVTIKTTPPPAAKGLLTNALNDWNQSLAELSGNGGQSGSLLKELLDMQ